MADADDGLDPDERAVLAWLRDGGAPEDDTWEVRAVFGDSCLPVQDLEEELRALGLNYREREDVRRKQRRAPQAATDRHRRTNLKRLAWYIDQRVDWTQTDLVRDHVVATWATLSGENLDHARRWWDAGLGPLDLPAITALVEHGLRPEDLATRVHGKALIDHLRRGSSVEWCLSALRWNRPA